MKISAGLGGSIVSRNIVQRKGVLTWCIREESQNELDNGWRFLSNIDTDEFLSNPSNMLVYDWGTIVEIEPAILNIFNMPIGTEITLIYENNKKYFIDTYTGEVIHS